MSLRAGGTRGVVEGEESRPWSIFQMPVRCARSKGSQSNVQRVPAESE